VRNRVIKLCKAHLKLGLNDGGNDNLSEIFWLRATMVNARMDTGQTEDANKLIDEALNNAPEEWMPNSLQEQLNKLQMLLANPASDSDN
jgi:hypothetical protein